MKPAHLDDLLRDGDALVVVPPFAGLDRPSLAAHLLQAAAAEQGLEVRVLYANLLFAAEIEEDAYVSLSYAPTSALLGERIFAAAAYGVPTLGRGFRFDPQRLPSAERTGLEQLHHRLHAIAARADSWAEELAEAIAARPFRAVGCTSTFEQTAASVALLDRLKRRRPDVVTLLGGANCDGEMAEGIRSLHSRVDFVFSGESERTFPVFLAGLLAGRLPAEPVVAGEPCMDLDSLPTPGFEEFYHQLAAVLPDSPLRSGQAPLWLPYETSRGCWWGAKRHCTFCGLNAQTMTHREKSPARVLAELGQLLPAHPTRQICMVDNIMPRSYFQTLLPRIAQELPDLRIFYEQKANLSLGNVQTLKQAGVHVIQPGIEALSSSLLARMKKGVSATQNLALLRYARSCDLALNWNLLYGFPGDSEQEYQETLALLPLLAHLDPPGGLYRLSIDRFSPYFDHPEDYGLGRIQPLASYASVLPDGAAVEKVAYHFTADYPSGILDDGDLLAQLEAGVARWQGEWQAADHAPPSLAVTQLEEDLFLLLDSRPLPGAEPMQFLDREQTAVLLRGGRPGGSTDCGWALERKLLVELDGRYVPLATAEPDLLRAFEPGPATRPAPLRLVEA